MDAGIAGVVGAALGAVATGLGAIVVVRSARHAAEAQRQIADGQREEAREQRLVTALQQSRQEQRDNYLRFMAELLAVSNSLDAREPDGPLPDTKQLEQLLTAMTLEAPSQVMYAAQDAAAAVLGSILNDGPWGGEERREFYSALSNFVSLCRQALHAPQRVDVDQSPEVLSWESLGEAPRRSRGNSPLYGPPPPPPAQHRNEQRDQP
jgi:hypothetical protein